jgi:hypothetical protein
MTDPRFPNIVFSVVGAKSKDEEKKSAEAFFAKAEEVLTGVQDKGENKQK